MEELVALFEARRRPRVLQRPRAQLPALATAAIDYFVSGAGSKIRSGVPSRMEDAHTVSWAPTCHFLLVTIDGDG